MYASVHGVDGSVTSLGAIDLTAPDGLGKLVANAKACVGRACAVPDAGAPSEWRSPSAPTHAQRPIPPVMTAPGSCRFRVPIRTAAGLQWGWRTMPCPPGLTPGYYVRVQPGQTQR
jgi:hypothetical protein